MEKQTRGVTTYAEYQWDGERYVPVREEGYDYDGPWALAHDVTAVWRSTNFKFYNDDGTDAAAENVTIGTGNFTTDDTIRLRADIGETAGANPTVSGNAVGWEYRKDGGTWTSVGTAGTEDCFVAASANVTNGAAITTQLLSGVTGSANFVGWGDYLDTAISFDPGNNFDDQFLETEISLGWNTTGTYEYRVTYASGTVPGTIDNTASIVVDAPSAPEVNPAMTGTGAASVTKAVTLTAKGSTATGTAGFSELRSFLRTLAHAASGAAAVVTQKVKLLTLAHGATGGPAVRKDVAAYRSFDGLGGSALVKDIAVTKAMPTLGTATVAKQLQPTATAFSATGAAIGDTTLVQMVDKSFDATGSAAVSKLVAKAFNAVASGAATVAKRVGKSLDTFANAAPTVTKAVAVGRSCGAIGSADMNAGLAYLYAANFDGTGGAAGSQAFIPYSPPPPEEEVDQTLANPTPDLAIDPGPRKGVTGV